MPHRRLARPQTPPRTRAAAARGPGPPPARACPHPPAAAARRHQPARHLVRPLWRRAWPAHLPPRRRRPPARLAPLRGPTRQGRLHQLPARGRRLSRQGRRHARQVRPLAPASRKASGTDGTSHPRAAGPSWSSPTNRHTSPFAVTIRPSRSGRSAVTSGSSPPGHDPAEQFPLACCSRSVGIAVRREAPSALAAALASSAAQPDSPEDDLTRPGPRHLDGSPKPRQKPAKAPPKPRTRWRTRPRLRLRCCRRLEPLRGASRPQKPRATGPPWGRGASAFDPSVSLPAVWKPPSAAIDSFSRPAAAWSARNSLRTCGAPPPFGGDPLPPCRGQTRTDRHRRHGASRSLAPLVTNRARPGVARLAVTIRSARFAVTIRWSLILLGLTNRWAYQLVT